TPTPEGLYLHHRAIAEAVPIPQILYNVPGRTAVDMHNDTAVRLAEISNIVGLKDATGDLERARDLVARCGDRIDLYSGDDATAMEFLLLGGKGVISVTANVVPAEMHQMCAAAIQGDRATAEAINARIELLHRNLFLEANPIPVKWALEQMGLIPEGIRLPLTRLSERYHAPVREALAAAGIAT
ncbi:MAG TPA: dihydrodipicolinate synthase family protein, partial [Thioalkalivibrio sp.]|nr:dihydrodipicolinate synthase family protein [Thioalkalivibrio sp.]